MKNAILIFTAVCALAFSACEEKEAPPTFKIRYQVVGDSIEEIKFNANNVNYKVKTKSSMNGWDTTFVHNAKQKLELQAKTRKTASGSLTAVIYLNDGEAARKTDAITDSARNLEVKAEFQIQ